MLVKNSSAIYYYHEDPESGVNVMVATLSPNQQHELSSKGYIIELLEANPDISRYDLIQLDTPNQADFYSNVGNVYLLSEDIALVRFNDDFSRQQIGEDSTPQTISFVDQRAELAKKNEINPDEHATTESTLQNTTRQKSITSHQETIYFLVAAIIFLIVLAIAAFIYLRTSRTHKS